MPDPASRPELFDGVLSRRLLAYAVDLVCIGIVWLLLWVVFAVLLVLSFGLLWPVLVFAPYALHGALIADLAPGHSIIEALQREGLDRIYVTDWRSASSEMRFLSIDHYLADLNVASILSWARPARIDLGHVPKMADWFKRCAERPAARAARDLQR